MKPAKPRDLRVPMNSPNAAPKAKSATPKPSTPTLPSPLAPEPGTKPAKK